ncbi:MAG TPA: TonB-dependent receptor [Rhizomicrobium sp.]|nr:TonB-dependent receptor [Rhizomicrobium sp.]
MVSSHASTTRLGRALLLGTAIAAITATAQSSAYAQTTVASNDETETVIVTGTRVSGMKAADSAAPIQIVGADALSHVGQVSLADALQQQVPSFNMENTGTGGDLGDFVLSAALRGLSPNETLVLVDGKRLHPTADLQVDAGVYQGAFAPDLSWIPVSSIDHVEVLLDGAAAQYGSDAVAGVVNIILKSDPDAGVAQATIGQLDQGGGESYDLTINKGFALGDKGFLNLTYDRRYHGFAKLGGPDVRVANPDGTPLAGLSYDPTTIPGYPDVNRIDWEPWSEMSTYAFNSGYDLASNVHAYAFGSYGTRDAAGYENIRLPSLIVGIPNAGGVGYTAAPIGTPGSVVYAPKGFDPLENIIETSYTWTGGFKGELWGFNWDLSSTYGKDTNNIYTNHSANRSLWLATGVTPTNFYDGAFVSTEWTNTVDLTREFNVGLYSPLTVAFGGEEREDTYQIQQGDYASTYEEGGQSFPGFLSTDAGTHDRKNYAGYVDFTIFPIEPLQIDVAGRYEHYTDFGNAPIGKVTARYDITPELAIRGTASTGFRAPTLGEEYYSATNVAPTYAFVQLPPDSAAAAQLGLQPLKPEHSTNYSIGFVAKPLDDVTMTLDAYSISVRDRIYSTGSLYGSAGGVVVSPAVNSAIAAHGNVLDPTVVCCGYTGINIFTNGLATDTKGLDFTANYTSDFDDYGSVLWTAAANYTVTTIQSYVATTPQLAPQPLFSQTSLTTLTDATPKAKVILAGDWTLGDWGVRLQETIYGAVSVEDSPDGVNFYKDEVPLSAITDLELDYNITHNLMLTLGSNNLFDKTPPKVSPDHTGANIYYAPNGISPYGIGGGFYYARVTIKL